MGFCGNEVAPTVETTDNASTANSTIFFSILRVLQRIRESKNSSGISIWVMPEYSSRQADVFGNQNRFGRIPRILQELAQFLPKFGWEAYNGPMPRFKPKGALEHSAVADLWKHTLSRIPTAYGRLTYLASLRDTSSGVYRHHGLNAIYGREESARAMRESHEQVFAEWMNLDLQTKTADLADYATGLEDPPTIVLKFLATTATSEFQLPDNARAMERKLFRRDFEMVVELLNRGSGGRSSGRASSPRG